MRIGTPAAVVQKIAVEAVAIVTFRSLRRSGWSRLARDRMHSGVPLRTKSSL
jgi:hypothetical protein